MVEEMLFFMVFITMLSLQRENRFTSLDECSKAVTCKHKGSDLYRSLQHFFLSPGVFFFFSKRSTNKKPSTEELESISCYLGLKCQITLVRLLAIASHRFLTVYVQVVELLADVFNHLSWMLSPLPFVQVSAKGT